MPAFPKKAMILAAGLGERLRPLTSHTPKPLLPINQVPLIAYNLALCQKFGVREVCINLYHLGKQIYDYGKSLHVPDLKLHYSFESNILGTGGGLKNAQSFFEDTSKPEAFFLMNADVLIDLDLQQLFQTHQNSQAFATLAVTESQRPDVKRFVFVDPQQRVRSIANRSASNNTPFLFTGVQILEPEALQKLPALSRKTPSCLIEDLYLPALAAGEKIQAFLFSGYWRDVGNPERYDQVQKECAVDWPYRQITREQLKPYRFHV